MATLFGTMSILSFFDCSCIPTISQALFTIVAFVVGKWALGMARSCCACCGSKEPAILKSDWKKDTVYLYQ